MGCFFLQPIPYHMNTFLHFLKIIFLLTLSFYYYKIIEFENSSKFVERAINENAELSQSEKYKRQSPLLLQLTVV